MSIAEILAEVEKHNCKFLMLTGGEPLEQNEIGVLVEEALAQGYEVVIETNGQQDIGKVPKEAVKILDLKCPGSAMHKKNDYSNMPKLDAKDEVKFVIKDRADYDWALEKCREYYLFNRVSEVLFSPVFGEIEPIELANWMLEDKLPARMQMQMHKFIWEPNTRGV
jgi:7-carboxy-7-deazaguanine synthase